MILQHPIKADTEATADSGIVSSGRGEVSPQVLLQLATLVAPRRWELCWCQGRQPDISMRRARPAFSGRAFLLSAA